MKKVYLVTCIFPITVDGREILATTYEGVFNKIADAEERLKGMVEEESKNSDEMYFEIKPVYVKKNFKTH